MLRGASAGSFGGAGASTGSLGGSRGRHDNQVVSQVALAMGRAPGSQVGRCRLPLSNPC
jgi:hypothetical protein